MTDDLYYIKLVGIGPNALAAKNGNADEVIKDIPGHYFRAPIDDIEQQLIDIIKRCFADRRQQMENPSPSGFAKASPNFKPVEPDKRVVASEDEQEKALEENTINDDN
jgi:hypothetical protein